MKRRLLLTAATRLALGVGACGVWSQVHAQPGYTVSAEQLQQVVAQRFPQRFPVAGLLDLNVQAPRLHLLPEQNRVSAEMAVEAAGPGLRRSHAGTFDMDFALRYEASDRTLRACQMRFKNLHVVGLPLAASEWISAFGPALAEQSMHELVLHRLRPQDLALFEGLGMQPGAITVTAKGLTIGFVQKLL